MGSETGYEMTYDVVLEILGLEKVGFEVVVGRELTDIHQVARKEFGVTPRLRRHTPFRRPSSGVLKESSWRQALGEWGMGWGALDMECAP